MKPTQALRRPAIRYHGGKWKLAPWIIEHFPSHRVYVEPFGGGASVLLRKPRSYAEVYNDLDGEVVNLFRVIREHGDELARAVALTPFSREEFELSRDESDDPVEQARRTVVRSHMGFGSNALQRKIKTGFRANSTRSGTSPARDWMNLPPTIAAVAERLRGVVIERKDARDVMRQHDSPGTLHYCDPPYVHETRSGAMHGFHGYNHEMTNDEHAALATVLRAMSGAVVLSGYACALYDVELYADWFRVERNAHADGARDRVEVLWLNAVAAASVADTLFATPSEGRAP